jgi:hypothetical protein
MPKEERDETAGLRFPLRFVEKNKKLLLLAPVKRTQKGLLWD